MRPCPGVHRAHHGTAEILAALGTGRHPGANGLVRL
jgi:hypothetical protein